MSMWIMLIILILMPILIFKVLAKIIALFFDEINKNRKF